MRWGEYVGGEYVGGGGMVRWGGGGMVRWGIWYLEGGCRDELLFLATFWKITTYWRPLEERVRSSFAENCKN